MPYFLTDQYREIIQQKEKAEQEAKENLLNGPRPTDGKKRDKSSEPPAEKSSGGPVGIYKSIFLRGKIEQQNNKRKLDRKEARSLKTAGS